MIYVSANRDINLIGKRGMIDLAFCKQQAKRNDLGGSPLWYEGVAPENTRLPKDAEAAGVEEIRAKGGAAQPGNLIKASSNPILKNG